MGLGQGYLLPGSVASTDINNSSTALLYKDSLLQVIPSPASSYGNREEACQEVMGQRSVPHGHVYKEFSK